MAAKRANVRNVAGQPVCASCVIADTPLRRLKGLLGRKELAPGEGLLLRPVSAIHTCFMRFPIDVVFLDDSLGVLRVVEDVKPWRLAARRKSRAVLELPAGQSRHCGIQPGDRLELGDGCDG